MFCLFLYFKWSLKFPFSFPFYFAYFPLFPLFCCGCNLAVVQCLYLAVAVHLMFQKYMQRGGVLTMDRTSMCEWTILRWRPVPPPALSPPIWASSASTTCQSQRKRTTFGTVVLRQRWRYCTIYPHYYTFASMNGGTWLGMLLTLYNGTLSGIFYSSVFLAHDIGNLISCQILTKMCKANIKINTNYSKYRLLTKGPSRKLFTKTFEKSWTFLEYCSQLSVSIFSLGHSTNLHIVQL